MTDITDAALEAGYSPLVMRVTASSGALRECTPWELVTALKRAAETYKTSIQEPLTFEVKGRVFVARASVEDHGGAVIHISEQ